MLIQNTSDESKADEAVRLDLSRQFSESITKECSDFFEPIAETYS